MQNLYVLDAVNFLFRSYYAIGPITSSKGESTGALFGFIRSVLKIIKDFSATHLIAVFDGPGNSDSRRELYADYKSHRKGMPEDLFPQLEWAMQFCTLMGIPYLCVPGVEADDVMGSIALWAHEKKIPTYLCSSDKDLCQLVSDYIFVLNPHKNNLLMNREKVKEEFGVFPEQMIDLLAMMGDASDNIPGLEGIGAKTAVALLNEFGSLEAILAHPEKLKGKKQEIFLNGKEMALLSKQLATIDTSLSFPQDELFFQIKAADLEKLKLFYQEKNFLSLLKELPDTTKTETTLVEKTEYILIDTEEELSKLIRQLHSAKELCIDTETTGLEIMSSELVGIGISNQPYKAWYIPFNSTLDKPKLLFHLKPLLESTSISFFGHNLKYDLHMLKRVGVEVKNIGFDTILASYLLSPHKQKHNLDVLCLEYFDKVKIPITELIGKGKGQITMREVALEKVTTYCCEDVDYTFRLKQLLEKELEQQHLSSLLKELELPLLSILFEMEERGIYLDTEELAHMQVDLTSKLAHLSSDIFAFCKETFNLNSPKQLGEVLFEKLQIRPAKKTTTGYSTSAEVLEALKDTSPVIAQVLEYRALEKLRSTYVEALPLQVDPTTKRIHCNFNQSVAATGRLSCQDPNLQNIPVRSEEGRKIRAAFKPELPNWSFLSADYSQIELRLLAHLSEDPALIQAFNQGEDIHAYTASLVFGVPLKEVSDKMRHAAKAVNFGIIYGQQSFGLSKELGISLEEAKTFIQTYFARYKKIGDYLENCKESARKLGYSLTISGRKRPIPEIDNANTFIRQGAERLAINTPLQGSAADLIKMSMLAVDQYLQESSSAASMILQIHDELIFEVPDDFIPILSKKVQAIMQGVMQLKIPLVVDVSIGKNWGAC